MQKATVDIRELKDKASSIIDRVEVGEAMTVTKNGRPVARIVSTNTPPQLAALIADGSVRAPEGPRYLPTKPPKPKGAGKSASLRLRGSALSLYLDPSVLVRLLVNEPGSRRLERRTPKPTAAARP